MSSRIDRLLSSRLAARKAKAIAHAQLAVEHLKTEGVEAFVIGSLASGQFMNHSDVDFFVNTTLNAHERARAEVLVRRAMDRSGLGYDIIYADDVRPECLPEFHDVKRAASDLFEPANEIGKSGSGDAESDGLC